MEDGWVRDRTEFHLPNMGREIVRNRRGTSDAMLFKYMVDDFELDFVKPSIIYMWIHLNSLL